MVSQLSRKRSAERDRRGITLLETLLAMVIGSSLILPGLGFLTLSMEQQVGARTRSAETSNLAAVDLELIRDVTNAKAAISSTAPSGGQRPSGDLIDCPGGPGAGGDVALVLIDSRNWRVVYSVSGALDSPIGRELWRRECPNQSTDSDATLADPGQLNSPDSAVTSGRIIGQRLQSVVGSCPRDPVGQDVSCRQVKLVLRSIDVSKDGSERPPVVLQATRRTDAYSVPGTPPIARFTYVPSNVEDLDSVQFDGSPSRDQRGGSLEYRWDFGSPVSSSLPYSSDPTPEAVLIEERTVADVPPMEVTLTVRNDEGVEASSTMEVVIGSKAPTAKFRTLPPIVATQGQSIELLPELRTYSTSKILATKWVWGDGEEEEVCPVLGEIDECWDEGSHVFMDIGTFIVEVSVEDTLRRTASAQISVKVEPDVVYVKGTGGLDNEECGPIAAPCKTINIGIDRAVDKHKPKVHVASDATPYAPFSTASGKNVVGSWQPDFTTRSPAGGARSVITATGSDSTAFGLNVKGVVGGSVEGFTINTSVARPNSGETTQGVLVDSSSGVTLKDLVVTGGKGVDPAGVLIKSSQNVGLVSLIVNSPEADGVGTSSYAVRALNSTVSSSNGSYSAGAGRPGADSEEPAPGKPQPAACGGVAGNSSGTAGGGCGGGGKGGALHVWGLRGGSVGSGGAGGCGGWRGGGFSNAGGGTS